MIESGYESDTSCRDRDWMSSLTDCETVVPAGSERCDRMSDGLRPGLLRTSSVAAGDPLPTNCELIEIHVSELKQLFNAIDPSPFRERDLDPDVEEFITDWANEASPGVAFGLAVYLDRPAGLANEPAELREAIHEFFRHRAELSRCRLRELFRRGRMSLAIGVGVVGVSVAGGNLVGSLFSNHFAEILKESFLIGGWVAMWSPLKSSSMTGGRSGQRRRSPTD
jgi:hypothetical protein